MKKLTGYHGEILQNAWDYPYKENKNREEQEELHHIKDALEEYCKNILNINYEDLGVNLDAIR